MRDLEGLSRSDANLRQLEAHKRTAIVPSGLQNACAIFRMLDEYAYAATGRRTNMRLLDFSDAGTLRLAKFAHDMVSWHFGLEELIVVALHMGAKSRAAPQCERAIPQPREVQTLK